jgi:hypothetical protein
VPLQITGIAPQGLPMFDDIELHLGREFLCAGPLIKSLPSLLSINARPDQRNYRCTNNRSSLTSFLYAVEEAAEVPSPPTVTHLANGWWADKTVQPCSSRPA